MIETHSPPKSLLRGRFLGGQKNFLKQQGEEELWFNRSKNSALKCRPWGFGRCRSEALDVSMVVEVKQEMTKGGKGGERGALFIPASAQSTLHFLDKAVWSATTPLGHDKGSYFLTRVSFFGKRREHHDEAASSTAASSEACSKLKGLGQVEYEVLRDTLDWGRQDTNYVVGRIVTGERIKGNCHFVILLQDVT
ncbi:hypothetical protein M8C21_007550 [Ambrosia artemisiifolia]|uniref:Uncharacterized protein n=1 Tax=Ambrosia artemisiifolia TaxID=4212 RepID=A0AAD5CAC4_AMBAR|nr:hypothetical protein M8C21_007550 [Ambrosia artemisiifolia]